MTIYRLHEKSATRLLEVFQRSKSGRHKQCVDVTVTSPPYWNLKNYGFKEQIGYGQSYNEYLADLERIFANIYTITKNTGSLWIVLDTFRKKKKDHSLDGMKNGELILLPTDLAKRVTIAGWKLQDIFIWKKDKTLPWSRKGQLRNIFEYILFFTKTDNFKFYVDRIRISDNNELKKWWVKYPERYNPKGAVPTDIWKYSIPVQGSWASGFLRHFCPFPVEMVERILLLTTNQGNTVLDPFTGSGVVLAVAYAMNRRYIGFELNPDYVRMFNKKMLNQISKEVLHRRMNWKQKQQVRSKLRQKILKLRLTKYPMTLVKQIYRHRLIDGYNHPINTVFAIKRNPNKSSSLSRWKLLKEEVYLILNTNMQTGELHDGILEIASKPPLSKFGIEPGFNILSKDTFIKQETRSPSFEHERLWLYQKGIMNIYHIRINFGKWKNLCGKEQWKEYSKNGIPPILSNVRVNQSVPNSR